MKKLNDVVKLESWSAYTKRLGLYSYNREQRLAIEKDLLRNSHKGRHWYAREKGLTYSHNNKVRGLQSTIRGMYFIDLELHTSKGLLLEDHYYPVCEQTPEARKEQPCINPYHWCKRYDTHHISAMPTSNTLMQQELDMIYHQTQLELLLGQDKDFWKPILQQMAMCVNF